MAKDRQIVLLVAPLFCFSSVALAVDMVRLAARETRPNAFTTRVVSETGGPVRSSSGMEVMSEPIGNVGQSDSVVVITSYEPEAACTPKVLSWIRQQKRGGAIIGCVETGAYVLSRAGILGDDNVLSTHHESATAYREILGEQFSVDHLYIESGPILSSGGGAVTMDIVLAIIDRLAEAPLSDRIAYIFNYRRQAESTRARSVPEILAAASDRRLARIIELMHSQIDSPVTMEEIFGAAGVEASTARRLFHAQLGTSPKQFHLQMRLRQAEDLLRNSGLPVGTIAAACGFSNAQSFAKRFRQTYGKSASTFRHRAGSS